MEEVVTQNTLDMLITQLENWQQGPGVFGSLIIHSCWGTSSVLDKQYQGETTTYLARQMRIIRQLYEKTGNRKWLVTANAMAAHFLYLQEENGGFIHATAEFEPNFGTGGCPIHWFYPIIALCEYYEWEYADESIKAQIPDAIDRQWEWSLKHAWKKGNGFKRPLLHPGWCGVTNQDMIAIHAIALSTKLFGHQERFEEYARPALDYLLTENYYHKEIGLFERGDGRNFAERTTYYLHILDVLEALYDILGEQRLIDAYDNVVDHMFDAAFVREDGLTYLARGAITDPEDKSKVYGWDYKGAIAFDHYPDLLLHMKKYLTRHPSAERAAILESLRDTIAAYVFEDGNFPAGLLAENPVFAVASISVRDSAWLALVIDILGDKLQDPKTVPIPRVHRSCRNITWKQNGRLWAIEEDGQRKYGGYTRYAAGVTKGPDQQPVFGNFDSLEDPEYIEIVD